MGRNLVGLQLLPNKLTSSYRWVQTDFFQFTVGSGQNIVSPDIILSTVTFRQNFVALQSGLETIFRSAVRLGQNLVDIHNTISVYSSLSTEFSNLLN